MIKFRYGVTFAKITDISLKKNKFKNLKLLSYYFEVKYFFFLV